MHQDEINKLRYSHDYVGGDHDAAHRRMGWILWATTAFMAVEIAAGYWFGSMALLADGWHMASHSAAFAISVFAYAHAKKHAGHERYSFGTWKAGVLAGFASAVLLAVIGANVMVESISRFLYPPEIQYAQAMMVAVAGLLVNILSAFLLHGKTGGSADSGHTHNCGHDHGHSHDHAHGHAHDDPVDLNRHSAYIHVIADALTSVLAIFALWVGMQWGWGFVDPAVGVLGAVLILLWSYKLVMQTASILMDKNIASGKLDAIRAAIESAGDNRIADFHVWQIGPKHYAAIISLVTHDPRAPQYYKNLLSGFPELAHVSIEINSCADRNCH